ncbi:MAG: Hsp20/alpha crystallin family protein [Candidatus Omnitrophota bacterium]
MRRVLTLLSALILPIMICSSCLAEDQVEDLKKQILELQQRVQELEQARQGSFQDPFMRSRDHQWDPLIEMRRMQEEMSRIFADSYFFNNNTSPRMFSSQMDFDSSFDIKETEDAYEITFQVGDLDEKTLNVEINEAAITVKGQRTKEESGENPYGVFEASSFSSFIQSIPVPDKADVSKVDTRKEDGKLVIKLPKKK